MWRDHMRATYVLCAVEFLERTAYYGLRALLVLLMVAPVARGGLGWPERDTLAFYGLFTGAVWCSPLIGGFIIDRSLGLVRAVRLGGLLLVLGYLSLWASLVLPKLLAVDTLSTLADYSATMSVPLGHWPDSQTLLQSVALHRPVDLLRQSSETLAAWKRVLQLMAALFQGGLVLIVLGNAFFKPSVTLLVGSAYRTSDPSRERAYLLFYMSVYAAVLIAGVGIGTVGERFGWSFGLAFAELSMLIAIATFLAAAAARVFSSDLSPIVNDVLDEGRLSVGNALIFIGAHALVAMVFWAAYEQSGGLMSLFISEQVNRSIAGWLVPASWFFSLTAVFAVLCGPLISLSLMRWERTHAPFTVSVRFALGLASGAVAYAVISLGSSGAGSASVSILWPLAFYCLLTVGELLFSPTGFAMVGRYAPVAHQSTFMGIWLLSIALGSFIGGQIGAYSRNIGRTATFAGLCAALSATALTVMLSRHFLLRRSLAG